MIKKITQNAASIEAIKATKKILGQLTRTQRICKGAQTAQRHLVELTRNQFTICSEEKRKTDQKSSEPRKGSGRLT
jgi:hypothetical protein